MLSIKNYRYTAAALGIVLMMTACAPGTQQGSQQATTSAPAALQTRGASEGLQGSGQGLAESGLPTDSSTEDPAVVKAYTDYANYIGQNLIDTWNSWFQQRGIPQQDVAFIIVPKGAQGTTTCTDAGGGTHKPVTDEGSAFFCATDKMADGRTGVIWLPLTSMIGIVNGDVYGNGQSQWPGDFAFAETIAHEFGHHVESSLEDWYTKNQPSAGVKPPRGAWNELLADCFAGNWTEAAYTQGALQNGDYDEAIAKIGLTGDSYSFGPDGSIIFDPSSDPHGAPNHRVGAYKVGVEGVPAGNYQPGDPQTCISYYWQADKDYTYDMVLPAG
ncbi:putative metalloprotease [Arthrobacter globiformis]|uniref:neutral zinc metallopeptidase n=1 Tax=Arthrobacter globiformis TaxID=1665 RepID=UPI002788814C|nr:neutral zinc metallopeptidase [Arthrobacter globiformis]MDQ1058165.1 putative metalloprotease [Arthrobacter globiformis]